MTATSPAFKPKVPVSVVHDVADNGSFFRGRGGGGGVEWDRAVSDRSVNCACFPELLLCAGNCLGIAVELRITSEVVSVLAQIIYREGLPPLVACLKQSAQQVNRAELVRIQKYDGSNSYRLRLNWRTFPGMGESVMVCFLCGRSGHGVSRCSRMDTVFPFSRSSSVDFRDGQYRAV